MKRTPKGWASAVNPGPDPIAWAADGFEFKGRGFRAVVCYRDVRLMTRGWSYLTRLSTFGRLNEGPYPERGNDVLGFRVVI